MENRMKTTALILVLAASIAMTGCTAATRGKYASIGRPHKVQMYSGGVCVQEWTSDGYVKSEDNSDGYYFTEKSSGKLVKVIGDIVISVL
jgi:hypothetical protein